MYFCSVKRMCMVRTFKITLLLLVLVTLSTSYSQSIPNQVFHGNEKLKTPGVTCSENVFCSISSPIIDNNSTIQRCYHRMGDCELPVMIDVNTVVETSTAIPAFNKIKFVGNICRICRNAGVNSSLFVNSKSVLSSSFCVLQRIINVRRILLT